MPKTLFVIGAGPAQLRGIQTARQMGLRVVAVDANSAAPGLTVADVPVVMDVKDASGALALAREQGVDGVVCFSIEPAVRTVASVAQALGLPGPSPVAAHHATNKHEMRRLWQVAGVPSPQSIPSRTLSEARRAAETLGLPVVIKPSDSAGSRGVSKVAQTTQLEGAYLLAMQSASNSTILVEEYMEGVEISVEAFVFSGKMHVLALSDKRRTTPPYLLDTRVSFPSEHSGAIQARACAVVQDAVRALGLDICPIHAEVMVTPKGPMMVELAARGPGFKVFTDMIPWVTGVDVVRELIRMSLGEVPDLSVKQQRGAVLRFPELAPGRVRGVGDLTAARSVAHITDLEIYVKAGDEVKVLSSGAARIGHIIALAPSRAEAEASIRKAEALLRIEMEPLPAASGRAP